MAWITSIYLLSVSQVILNFNIEPVAWKYISAPASGFGYKVVQINSTNLLISAPVEQYEQSKRGKVYQCLVGGSSCTPLPIEVPSYGVNMSLGLSMTKDPKTSKILVCGPTIPRDCKTITTYNGMCLEIDTKLNIGSPMPLSLEECPGQTDIAFLLDGSGSIYPADFKRMKDFVKNLITQFLHRNTQFAIIQFSTDSEIHMSFNYFKNNIQSWESKLYGISQQQGWTYTAKAINRIVQDVFIANQGSRPNAEKILIVITDGESTDSYNLKSAIQAAETAKIIRFAIGVGSAFYSDRAKNELSSIASSPQTNHMFQVDNFQALDQISNSLQNSIFPIEGSQTTGESIKMEMAQEGMSAAYIPGGGFQVASVGAFQWRGAYQEYTSATKTPILKQSPNMEPDSYMGYSMAVASTSTRQFTILGAPRFKHSGRVEVFSPGATYSPTEFSGQIGTYFGAEICVVDLDKDSYTDLVIISAPMFKDRDREGRVFVCTLKDRSGMVCEFTAEMTMEGDLGNMGRFGTSLAPLPDMNMDGFNDLAVGAPLENNGQGSVYIFLGARGGISNIYSQRISGLDVKPGLKFFGLSISQSSLDMNSDFLPDLAVGSKGAVILLRSKPIVTVRTQVTFNPAKIPTDTSNSSTPLKQNATVCFTMTKNTADNTKDQAIVNYTLTLDVTRQAPNYRAYYNSKNKIRKETKTVTLGLGEQCFDQTFYIVDEPDDALNELSNELYFTFEGLQFLGSLSSCLSPQSLTTTYHPLSFEINCGSDNNCVDNLKVDFNFTGFSEMRVGIDDLLNVTVSVESREENSYNSRIILTYPAGLSFRRSTTIQGRVECNSIDGENGITRGKSDCTINKPIFKSNSKAFFVLSYGIDSTSQFQQLVTFTANASRHEDSTRYINFTATEKNMKKILNQSYVVVNYVRDFNLTVIIKVPMKLGIKDIWANPNGLQISGCQRENDEKPIATDFVSKLKTNAAVDCSVATCGVFMCNVFLSKGARSSYSITGNISSGWIEQIGLESARFSLVSSATLHYDRNQYIYFSSDSKNNPPVQTIETEVEVYPEIDFTKEIIGGAVGGLFLLALITAGLYKVGFFKSKYKQFIEDDVPRDEGSAAKDE
ncbi:integrin alpha-M isoform X2 [Esox lucius]|uniref:integrin alpha-M isoform X2 n=1 Tax=Esox lucius TaxID=8010 RepID=UPI000973304B|nr:integrin alpha-M isoform X2 [Esox lucius]